jgi:hypothetical protein
MEQSKISFINLIALAMTWTLSAGVSSNPLWHNIQKLIIPNELALLGSLHGLQLSTWILSEKNMRKSFFTMELVAVDVGNMLHWFI